MTTRTTGADLFGATLLFSLLLHGVVILGITFDAEKPKPSVPTLDVTLVDIANQEPPDKAEENGEAFSHFSVDAEGKEVAAAV